MPFKRGDSNIYYIRVAGVRRSSGTSDYEAAAALEAKLNHEAWLAKRMEVAKPRSWEEACVQWEKERGSKKSFKDDLCKIAWFHPHLKSIDDINKITRKMIDELMQKHRPGLNLKEPCSENATANRYVAFVSGVLHAAAEDWEWGNKVPKLRRYLEIEGKDVFLEVEQWHRLRDELPEHLLHTATFAIATGLRASNVFGLQERHIDLKRRSMVIPGSEAKKGKPISIPLNDTAMWAIESALAARNRDREERAAGAKVIPLRGNLNEDWVFTFQGKRLENYGDSWYKAMDRAGLGTYTVEVPQGVHWTKRKNVKTKWEGNFNWHGLRHTFNSWLAREGVPKEMRDRLCGWSKKSKEMSDRYTHLDVEALRPFTAVLDVVIRGDSLSSHDKRTLSSQLLQVTAG